jgi:hypothetical protein
MSHRFTAPIVAMTTALATALVLTPGAVESQAPAVTAQAYTPARTPNGQPDLQGIWQVVNAAASNLEDHSPSLGTPGGVGVVEGGRIPYLAPALAKRKENFEKRATADPEANCYLPGVPRITYTPFPFQILQFPDQVTIVYEYLGITRSIFLTGKHPDPNVADFWMGDSRGRWEGNTLVVDVTNFNDQTWFDRAGNFHSDALHVTERYTRAGPDHIAYEATIEDPEVFSRPWKISMPLYRRQERNLRLLEYECYAYMEEEAGKGNLKLPWSQLEREGVPKK